jgi:hypothetical protein
MVLLDDHVTMSNGGKAARTAIQTAGRRMAESRAFRFYQRLSKLREVPVGRS